jgi:hypothetical protein
MCIKNMMNIKTRSRCDITFLKFFVEIIEDPIAIDRIYWIRLKKSEKWDIYNFYGVFKKMKWLRAAV